MYNETNMNTNAKLLDGGTLNTQASGKDTNRFLIPSMEMIAGEQNDQDLKIKSNKILRNKTQGQLYQQSNDPSNRKSSSRR